MTMEEIVLYVSKIAEIITAHSPQEASIKLYNEGIRPHLSKAPVTKEGMHFCPSCNNLLIETKYGKQKHCDECGQKIDWKETKNELP